MLRAVTVPRPDPPPNTADGVRSKCRVSEHHLKGAVSLPQNHLASPRWIQIDCYMHDR
jgi:hypothetical protein